MEKTAMQLNPSSKSSIRCPHCAGPLSKEMETSEWTVPPFIRDSFSMIGTAVGGTTSAFYGFNHVFKVTIIDHRHIRSKRGSRYMLLLIVDSMMPIVRRWIKGPMWLHFLVGAPPVIVFSSACAGLAGGAVPALAQLASSSYHAAISSSTLKPSSSQDEKINKP